MPKPPERFWLAKSEPDVYAIDDLERQKRGVWEGVRNFQARNFLREMKAGDLVLFYHSNATPPGVVGLAKVAREAYPDPFQFDPKSPYHDPKSKRDDPRWSAVDVEHVETFPRQVPLDELRAEAELEGMRLLMKGSRLSVMPVEPSHFRHVLRMAGAKTRVRP